MPALEALLDKFEAAHTQALGISVDSKFCHANWAESLGGVSFPLLADFHPKGEVAKKYGLYLEEAGITDRATVIIDADGVVKHISAVGPPGERDIGELLKLCQKVDADYKGDCQAPREPGKLPAGTKAYVRAPCAASTAVRTALANLHLLDQCEVKVVTDNEANLKELKDLTGAETAPVLVREGKPLGESADIVKELAKVRTGF